MNPIRIRREIDLEWMRDIFKLGFPDGEPWPGDDDLYWIATRGSELLAFASARPLGDMLELTSCAVVASSAGTGMQRRLLRVRESYAKRTGCKTVCTYTTRDNYASITNLIRAGYRFTQSRSPLYFHFVKRL